MKRGRSAAGSSKRVKVTIVGEDEDGVTVATSKSYGPLAAEAHSQELRTAHVQERAGARARSASSSPDRGDNSNDYSDDYGPLHLGDSRAASPASSNSSTHIGPSEDVSRNLRDAFVTHLQPINLRPPKVSNWGLRRARCSVNWAEQVDDLADAFLEYKHTRTDVGAPAPQQFPQHTSRAEILFSPTRGAVQLVDISGIAVVPRAELHDQRINVALLQVGYLGSSPMNPTIAFSLRTLLLFERLRARARTGKMNFVRAFCDILNIPYMNSFRNRFVDAVDALARIQRAIDLRVRTQLQRDRLWRVKNGCAACSYKCEEEEPLKFSRQLTVDGNNSLRRFASTASPFDSPFTSDYLLGREYTEQFKDEVQRQRAQAKAAGKERLPTDDAATGIEDTECSSRWRNARPENEKTAQWDALDETGVFICACRHGFIVAAVDMWQSGELAKYPLAIIFFLIQLLGDDGLLQLGYDIGCAHSGTAGRSSFGDRVKALFRFVVGSFHGHAHNRPCQLGFHPRYVEGTGREDFETCERIFSVTNLIASITRHATPFHRHEDIDLAFATSDSEKYAALGVLLRHKLKDAQEKILEHAPSMRRIENTPRYTDDFFKKLLDAERRYLAGNNTVTQPEVQEELAHEYMIALDRLSKAQVAFDSLDLPVIQYHGPNNADGADRAWLAARRRLRKREEDVEGLEQRMGITERWTTTTPAYIDATRYNARRTYAKVLDELERAVVSRLLELEKMNMRSTGYKLRQHIAKALNRRGATLVSALQRYNKAAKALTPPRPTLTREQVLDIAFLADFPILRQDVGTQEWAQPAVRQLTTAWAETARAREEEKRIRIESVRIRTWIRDEEQTLDDHIELLKGSTTFRNRLLARELDFRAQFLHNVHTRILADLDALDAADGLDKPRLPGRKLGEPEGTRHRTARDTIRVAMPPLVITRTPSQHSRAPGGEVPAPATDNADEDEVDEDDDGSGGLGEEVENELDAFLQTVQAIAR